VEKSLEQPVANSTYLEFFGLSQPPFGRISDPNHLFQTEQYSLLMEHMVNATKRSDSLVAICGADGSGKSTLIERYASSLGDHINSVVIDETCHSELQFYNAFLTQIGFTEITGTADELKNISKEFLVCRGIAGDHVLLIVDNAHQTALIILEQLRWISEIKIKDRRVISVVLAGNTDLIHVINSPTVSEIKFRSRVLFNIRKYSGEETASYVRHGLRSVGGSDAVKLAKEANSLIHRYSGGNPQQINGLCNGMLAEAYRLKTRVIGERVVRVVADRQGLLPHVTPLHGKGRRKNDPDFEHVKAVPKTVEANACIEAPTSNSVGDSVPDSVPVIVNLGREGLLEQLSRLAEKIEDFRADKIRATQDIDAGNHDILKLRNELDKKTAEVEKLTLTIAINKEEITRLNLLFSGNSTASQASENRSKRLDADLVKEIRAKKSEEKQLAVVAEEAVTESTHDPRIDSSQVVAIFEQSIANVRAYQALRQYQPDSYDDLVTTYTTLIGQDRTNKQVSDALRAKQAKIAERLLPKTSDEAIIAYARLIINQLDEFQLEGCEPCLTALIPQSGPDNDVSPIYSESTKDRELDTLDMALRTYDADKPLPTGPDVWPDLQPIFEKLFKAFGVDNVAALQNSYDPSVDRALVCIVGKALYSMILQLPKPNAANALRWLLSE
jgi:general secretion pathway protein A